MAEREKYYIGLNGQIFEVSKELYETYYKGQRKEKYFPHDLKQEHTKVDKETGEMIVAGITYLYGDTDTGSCHAGLGFDLGAKF